MEGQCYHEYLEHVPLGERNQLVIQKAQVINKTTRVHVHSLHKKPLCPSLTHESINVTVKICSTVW